MIDEDMLAECMEHMDEDLFTDREEEFLHEVVAQKDDGLDSLSDKQRKKLKEIYEKMDRELEAWEEAG